MKADVDEATRNMNSQIDRLVADFTDADKETASLAEQKLELAKELHVAGLILVTIQPLLAAANTLLLGEGAVVLNGVEGAMVGAFMGTSSLVLDDPRFGV